MLYDPRALKRALLWPVLWRLLALMLLAFVGGVVVVYAPTHSTAAAGPSTCRCLCP